MLANPRLRLQTFAPVLCWFLIVVGIVTAIIGFSYGPEVAVYGILMIPGGYLTGLCCNAFGMIVQDIEEIRALSQYGTGPLGIDRPAADQFCRHCGTKTQAGSQFCPHCGQRL